VLLPEGLLRAGLLRKALLQVLRLPPHPGAGPVLRHEGLVRSQGLLLRSPEVLLLRSPEVLLPGTGLLRPEVLREAVLRAVLQGSLLPEGVLRTGLL